MQLILRPLPDRLRYLAQQLDIPIARCGDKQATVTLVGCKLALEMIADELDGGTDDA